MIADRTAEREEFLSVHEVAALLRLAPQTVRKQIREGAIPSARFGHTWRVRRSDLEAMFGK